MNDQAMTISAPTIEARLGIGGNKPPGPIEIAKEVQAELAEFIKQTPVIETQETAKTAKGLLDRVKGALAELEDERDIKVRPLNTKVKEINDLYNTKTKKPIQAIVDELIVRLNAFADAEEARRTAAAAEAARLADEKERVAREAEEREREAKEDAAYGEIGIDVSGAIIDADQAFSEFQQTARAAARAARDIPVRLTSGSGRAMTMRQHEVLVVESFNRAIKVLGPTDDIREAILKGARAYRKLHGNLPDGVTAEINRSF